MPKSTTKSTDYIRLYDLILFISNICIYRLLEPSKCRIGPKYGGYCSFCKNETLENHGIVLFSKVRFDVKTLTVIGEYLGFRLIYCSIKVILFCPIDDDFSFTNVIYGNPVPYGHSGDCYSSLPECQHVIINR